MSTPPSRPGLWASLFEAGVVIGYLGLLAYVAGWSYLDRWFAWFGINTAALDKLNDKNFAIYALWVLRDEWLWIAVFVILLGVGVLSAVFLALAARLPVRRYRTVAEATAFTMVAAIGLILATAVGHQRADGQLPALIGEAGDDTFRRVIVTAKPNTATAAFLADKSAAAGCLRKLYMDSRTLYLYPGYKSLVRAKPPVYILPLGEIATIEVTNTGGLCDP